MKNLQKGTWTRRENDQHFCRTSCNSPCLGYNFICLRKSMKPEKSMSDCVLRYLSSKEKAEIQGLHFNRRKEKDKQNLSHFVLHGKCLKKTTWISAQDLTPCVFLHDFLFESAMETWKGKVLLNHLLPTATTVSGTHHENLYIYVGKVLGTQIQLQCTRQDEGFLVRKLRFNSEPELECSISKFYPNAASKDRSLVIKVAIVRKSHLRCFVNPNLTFMLVGPEKK